MRSPFTVFRRCRELEIENLKLKSTCADLSNQLEKITAMRADYPGIEPCRSQRCLKCAHAVIYYPDYIWRVGKLIGCARHAECDGFLLKSE